MIDSEHGGGPEHSLLARFAVHTRAGVRTVEAHGEIDVSNVGELQDTMTDLSNAALGVVLDLNATTYIDSAVIRLLYELRRRLARRGQILLVVSRPGSNVHRVLELAAFFGAEDPLPESVAQAAATIRTRLSPDVAG